MAARIAGLRRRLADTRRAWRRAPGAGQLDAPAAGAVLERKRHAVRGWAFFFREGAPERVEIWLGDRLLGHAEVGLPRDDVAAEIGTASSGRYGFELAADLASWDGPGGETLLRAVAYAGRRRLELQPVALAVEAWTPGRGQIDSPRPGARVSRGIVNIHGWAYLWRSGPPARVELWLGDQPLGPARLGLTRPDIRALIEEPAAIVAGFELTASLSDWPAGDEETELRTVATGLEGERLELEPVPIRVVQADDKGVTRALRRPQRREPRSRGLSVLFYTHQLDLGGAQILLLDLVRGLVERGGVSPAVVATVDGPTREGLEELGVPVHVATLPFNDEAVAHQGRVEEFAAWLAHAHSGPFDVAFVNTVLAYPGAEAAAMLGIPVVWAIHESFQPEELWMLAGARTHPDIQVRAEAALRNAKALLFEAEGTAKLFEPLVGADRCHVVPYGMDLQPIEAARSSFDSATERCAAEIPDEADVVVCIGTVEPRKAQTALAQAFTSIADRHPTAHLVFVGGREDQWSDGLADFLEDCGPPGRTRLIPITGDVARWYGMADILVCASDVESLPRSVLEAMVWEAPVLATNVFGLPDVVIEGETGWLCEPRDVEALARGLDRALATNHDERRRMGSAGRALVKQRHQLDPYAESVQRLLDLAMSSGTGTGATAGAPAETTG